MIGLDPIHTLEKSRSSSSILRLPSELLHSVCTHLTPSEVANFRLLHRDIAAIGIRYLVLEIDLFLTKESFRRLQCLSEHHSLSRNVNSIMYYAESLPVYRRNDWEGQVLSPEARRKLRALDDKHSREPLNETLTDTQREEVESSIRQLPHQYSREELDQAFARYEYILTEQKQLRTTNDCVELLAKAMRGFPMLNHIEIVIHNISRDDAMDDTLQKTYAATYCFPCEGYGLETPSGLSQVLSVLLAAHQAGVKLENLELGGVSWQLLKQDKDIFAAIKESMSGLRSLDILLCTNIHDLDEYFKISDRECDALLKAGKLFDLVTSSPSLRHLNVEFDVYWGYSLAVLKYVVGDFHWHDLSEVEFTNMQTTENDLIGFFLRHSGTLSSVSLGCIYLNQGDWASAFQRMRQVLDLKLIELDGGFTSDIDGEDRWELSYSESPKEKMAVDTLRKAVNDFVIGKGEIPLIYDFLAERGVPGFTR